MVYCQNCGIEVASNVCQNRDLSVILGQTQPQEPQYQQTAQPTTPQQSRISMFKVFGIITIIIVALVILAALFIYSPEPDEKIETTPKGRLQFTNDMTVPGKYYGTFGGSVESNKIEIALVDASLGNTAVMDKPDHGDVVQIPNGCNLTYYDYNDNNKLDGASSLLIQGGEPGDMVSIIFKPTGEIIATAILD